MGRGDSKASRVSLDSLFAAPARRQDESVRVVELEASALKDGVAHRFENRDPWGELTDEIGPAIVEWAVQAENDIVDYYFEWAGVAPDGETKSARGRELNGVVALHSTEFSSGEFSRRILEPRRAKTELLVREPAEHSGLKFLSYIDKSEAPKKIRFDLPAAVEKFYIGTVVFDPESPFKVKRISAVHNVVSKAQRIVVSSRTYQYSDASTPGRLFDRFDTSQNIVLSSSVEPVFEDDSLTLRCFEGRRKTASQEVNLFADIKPYLKRNIDARISAPINLSDFRGDPRLPAKIFS